LTAINDGAWHCVAPVRLLLTIGLAFLFTFSSLSTGFASIEPGRASANGSSKSESTSIVDLASANNVSETGSEEFREFSIPTLNSGPNAIVAGPNNTLWFVEYAGGKIGEFLELNSSFKEFQIPESGAVPASLAIDHLGRIWFSDQSGPGSIWMLDPATDHFVQYPTISKESKPLFILIDSENDVWFTESTANKIGELQYPGYKMSEYTLPVAASGPVEMTFGSNQSSIWITQTYTGQIARFDVSSHKFNEFTPPSSVSLISPVGIVLDDQGDVWISEHGGSAVVELTPSNSTFKKFPTSVPVASSGYDISAVATLAIDSGGRLWFVEHFANRVGVLNPGDGTIEEFDIPSKLPAYSVLNTLDSNGNFWFTDYGSNQIMEIPRNASAPIVSFVEHETDSAVKAGQTINETILVTNKLNIPVDVYLNSSSSFSQTGITNPNEVYLNASTLDIQADASSVVEAKITPPTSLQSGLYSVAITATDGNDSVVGISFFTVIAPFSINQWFVSNYQIVLVIVIVILAVAYFATRNLTGSQRKK
jgi:virginiamycin B lyase